MLLCCWSAKGGSGATVVAAAVALSRARPVGARVLLVDLIGDAPAALGLPAPSGAGLSDWVGAGADVPVDALERLETPVGPGLTLLNRGSGPLQPLDRVERCAAALAASDRTVVVDCGLIDPAHPERGLVAARGHRSLLVTRACFLALDRARGLDLVPSGVVLVVEPGRALGRTDVAEALGAPVIAEVALDPAVARAVDSGLLATRLPRRLLRAVRDA